MVRFRPARWGRASSGRRPAPNYFSRSMQMRLLVMVTALMLVLVLMGEARKPKNWAWMWAGADRNSGSSRDVGDEETVHTRLPPRPMTSNEIPGTIIVDTPPEANLEEALQAVQDDTVWRSSEREAWFRLLERLKTSDNDELRESSLGRVGFLPLFKQPDVYRGKLVTVRGTARLAYRVQAPSNVHGIDGYFVFWLRLAGGPNSPLAVYALETPPGFPPIRDKDLDGDTTTLEEDVEFTGYFFKRWAYRAKDGLSTVPLLLAKSPRWLSAPSTERSSQLPTPAIAAVSVLAVAILSIVVAITLYRASASSPLQRRGSFDLEQDLCSFTPSAEDDGHYGVEESLRRLANGKIDSDDGM